MYLSLPQPGECGACLQGNLNSFQGLQCNKANENRCFQREDQDNRSSLTSAHAVNGQNKFAVGRGLKRPMQSEVMETRLPGKAGMDRTTQALMVL